MEKLYAILTNKEAYGRKGSIVAIIRGVKSEDVINVFKMLPEEELQMAKEVILDLSDTMRKVVRRCFASAIQVIGRFHVQKLAGDAV